MLVCWQTSNPLAGRKWSCWNFRFLVVFGFVPGQRWTSPIVCFWLRPFVCASMLVCRCLDSWSAQLSVLSDRKGCSAVVTSRIAPRPARSTPKRPLLRRWFLLSVHRRFVTLSLSRLGRVVNGSPVRQSRVHN